MTTQIEATYRNDELGVESTVHCVGARYVVTLRDTDADEEVMSRTSFVDRGAAIAYAIRIAGFGC